LRLRVEIAFAVAIDLDEVNDKVNDDVRDMNVGCCDLAVECW